MSPVSPLGIFLSFQFTYKMVATMGHRIHMPTQETQKTWVRCLGWEDPPEKEMATQASILAWRIAWTEELGRLQFMQRWTHSRAHTHAHTHMHTHTHTHADCDLYSTTCLSEASVLPTLECGVLGPQPYRVSRPSMYSFFFFRLS